ncbi:MAG TPA: plastocyanin/azurin family copper-binding protein [Methylomirabilota bacterium]|nr:plastocyanin/azurin family copper-binding protein [Methylomirabilota bacterium]
MRRRWELGVVLAGAFGIAAVAPAPSSPGVEIQLFRFRPARLEVQPGTQVRWTNRDDITHTITGGTPEAPQAAFRLVLEGRGAVADGTFVERGTYPYFCERHHHMRGEIRVQ